MNQFIAEFIDISNQNCEDAMKQFPDNYFKIAIVDPPYGISSGGENWKPRTLSQGAGKLKGRAIQSNSDWDNTPPSVEYFNQLKRISENQIIWGGNYFNLSPARCVIAWDKEQPWENFSAWEMAWTSFDMPAKLFRFNNVLFNRGKIHPTQKPVELYAWLLNIFAKPGDKILDTHLGSGSIAIACHYFKCHLTGYEISPKYFSDACERIRRETLQQSLF